MKIDLSGKTAVITGSTLGIGLAIAKGLAEAGAAVAVNGRTQQAVDKAVAAVKAQVPGATVTGIAADVGTKVGCERIIAAVPQADILVNNVGIYGTVDFFETPDEMWEHIYAVNVLSGVRLARAYLPGMVERDWGRVIFVSSESGLNIPVDMIHYGVTKTADIALARGLAKRMAGTNVTVNSVLPGPTLTEGFEPMLAERRAKTGKTVEEAANDFVREDRSTSLLRRPATAEEVANMVVYVASPQASATTGAALRVDGGVVDTIA